MILRRMVLLQLRFNEGGHLLEIFQLRRDGEGFFRFRADTLHLDLGSQQD